MQSSLSAKSQSVKDFLEITLSSPFVIPEYQRPYSWSRDQIDDLINDIWEFSVGNQGSDNQSYFLGCIIYFENKEHEAEIIDGQQRLTTLFLILRAIFDKIKDESLSLNDHVKISRECDDALIKLFDNGERK